MKLKDLKAYCQGKNGAAEDYPFGPTALVYKVRGKMFALISEDSEPLSMNLKCDPDEAEMIRNMYPAVTPGYHMNKRHWNTVTLDGTIDTETIHGMIDDSYDLVVKGLPKAVREELTGGKG